MPNVEKDVPRHLQCDMGCQPDWHHDECAIYLPAPAEKEAPFIGIPSGIDIAHYFIEETARRNRGCDGIDLYREGRDYCYLWVEATVDLDMWEAYLLDIRTHVDVPPGEMGETRDFLFVMVGAGGMFEVEWFNKPHRPFNDPTDDSWERFSAAMKWFADLIEKSVEDQDARVNSAR